MTADNGEETEHSIPFLKGYTVFNCEQIDSLPGHFTAPAAPVLDPVQRIARAETFFGNTGITIRYGGNQAFYAIARDYIQMPPFESFRDAVSFYATLAHETCHATRHPTRLDREFGRKRWGDEGYAAEELVGTRQRLSLRRSQPHARAARRSRRLYRKLVARAEERKRWGGRPRRHRCAKVEVS